jgi:signal transduction histidine kinase/ActR/RegA family two-component response regulator
VTQTANFENLADTLNDRSLNPVIVFTEFKVFNQPVKVGPDDPLQKPISKADKITLSYDQTVFSISYRIKNYSSTEKIEFFYFLVGFDRSWQKDDGDKSIRYTNIKPGRYLFEVKASKNNSLRKELKASIAITITPPYWATLPFRLLASLVGFLILYGLYKFRTHSITKRNKELLGMIRELNNQIYQRMELQRELEQTQKLDSIGTLAGGIAHDFNNLLTVIKGYSDLALMKMQSKKDVIYKNISEVRAAAERAENLTNQILSFSRKQIYRPQIVDINSLILNSNKMAQRLIGEDVAIEKKLSPGLPPIKADPIQIEQILINLITNARDAINYKTKKASEKKIIIQTDQEYLDKAFSESHIESSIGQHVIISISDNGIGMSKEVKEKIFEPFYTTKDIGKGTGLGLATVYGIVKQNKGNIYVYSEPDQGTTFKIFWPASQGIISDTEENESDSVNLTGNELLMIVEDDDAVRDFAFSALSDLGYKVMAVESGHKALELLKDQKHRIDLLITDLIMPGMNGKELSQKIKKHSPKTDILFVSGYTEEHIAHGGKLDKNVRFLAKPYTIVTIAKKVREILDHKF